MVLKGFMEKLNRKEPQPQPVVAGNDGWVEMAGGRIIVHDPIEDGRYATIGPEGCVRLFINDEEVTEATAVAAADSLRFEVKADPVHFFETAIADDHMSVTLEVESDPHRTPDTVALVGRHQARLVPDYSRGARPRPFHPKQLIIEHLLSKGVVFGVDEAAIAAEVNAPSGRSVVVARGQEPRPAVCGAWVWRLEEFSLAEAGQVIAEYTGDQPSLPRISVLGERTSVFEDPPQPPGYLAGNGTRVVQPGRLVASASGRARAVPAPQGMRVHIFPVHVVGGDLTGPLELQADLIVRGSVADAAVTTAGEILIMGGVQRSELSGELITVKGAVVESRLGTVPAGHPGPLRGELAWINERIKAMRTHLLSHKPITEDMFREVSAFVRGMRRRAEQLAICSEEFQAATEDLARVFMGAQTWTAIDLPALGRLLGALERALKVGDQAVAQGRDVRLRSLERSTVWSGREIRVEERIQESSLHAAGSILTPDGASIARADLVAGGEIKVGSLNSGRGATAVVVRSPRAEIAAGQAGTAFEFGGERKVFERDQEALTAVPNAKGQLIFRSKEA